MISIVYVSLPEEKAPFSHGFPVVFPYSFQVPRPGLAGLAGCFNAAGPGGGVQEGAAGEVGHQVVAWQRAGYTWLVLFDLDLEKTWGKHRKTIEQWWSTRVFSRETIGK